MILRAGHRRTLLDRLRRWRARRSAPPTVLADEPTARERAMPAVAKVADDAVARHERRYHGTP